MLLNPKESGEFIVKHAQHVQVHEMGIKNLAHQVKLNKYQEFHNNQKRLSPDSRSNLRRFLKCKQLFSIRVSSQSGR